MCTTLCGSSPGGGDSWQAKGLFSVFGDGVTSITREVSFVFPTEFLCLEQDRLSIGARSPTSIDIVRCGGHLPAVACLWIKVVWQRRAWLGCSRRSPDMFPRNEACLKKSDIKHALVVKC